MNIIDKIEKEQLKDDVADFNVGDSVKVHTRVVEGGKERIQIFAGLVIGRKGSGVNAAFTVRKISYGEGVERVFPLYSNRIDSIEVVRKGKVRRAKLYYLRDRRGKSARISERTTGHGMESAEEAAAAQGEMTQTAKRAAKKAEKEARRAEGRAAQEKIKADKAAAKEAEAKAAAAEAAAAETPAEEAPAEE